MLATGELKIHKADVRTRPVKAVKILNDGSIAVWDSLPDDYTVRDGKLIETNPDSITISHKEVEPDIIARPDQWERVEREGHSWKRTTPQAIQEEAEKRDDVDEDELPDNL